jgi:hypothetical protein
VLISPAGTGRNHQLYKLLGEVKMVSQNGNDFKKFGIGFLIGVATGTAIALMYAPQSGSRTREQIKEKVEEVVEKAKETAGRLKHKEE